MEATDEMLLAGVAALHDAKTEEIISGVGVPEAEVVQRMYRAMEEKRVKSGFALALPVASPGKRLFRFFADAQIAYTTVAEGRDVDDAYCAACEAEWTLTEEPEPAVGRVLFAEDLETHALVTFPEDYEEPAP